MAALEAECDEPGGARRHASPAVGAGAGRQPRASSSCRTPRATSSAWTDRAAGPGRAGLAPPPARRFGDQCAEERRPGGEYSFAAVSSARVPAHGPDPASSAGRVPGGRDLRNQLPATGTSAHPVRRSLNRERCRLVWWVTVGVTIAVLLFDVVIVGRRPHEPSCREVRLRSRSTSDWPISSASVSGYFAGQQYGTEFFAGWLTEYSLSVDNLFIFLIIMCKFAVPRQYQQTALMVGIVLALIMRGSLHRRRRGRDQQVQLGVLPLRPVPDLHRREAGQARAPRTRRTSRRAG